MTDYTDKPKPTRLKTDFKPPPKPSKTEIMTEAEFTRWVQKTHKTHKWQTHMIAETYADLKVKEALEEIEKSLISDREMTLSNYEGKNKTFASQGVRIGIVTQRNKTQEAINKLKS